MSVIARYCDMVVMKLMLIVGSDTLSLCETHSVDQYTATYVHVNVFLNGKGVMY